jgi:hypothetical protein
MSDEELAQEIKSKTIELGLLIEMATQRDMSVTLTNHIKKDALYYKQLERVDLLGVFITKTTTIHY